MKYQIEATIVKDGGEPVHWYCFSDKALSEKDCLKMLSQPSMYKMQFSEIGCYWVVGNGKAGKQAQIKLKNFIKLFLSKLSHYFVFCPIFCYTTLD